MTMLLPQRRSRLAAVAVCLLLPPAASGQETAPIRLSPDGEYVAALVAGESGARNLVSMRLADGSAKRLTGYTDSSVSEFFWASDKRLVFDVDISVSRDEQRRPYSATILRDGSGARKLHARRGRNASSEGAIQGGGPRLLHRLPNRPNEVLVAWAIPPRVLPEVLLLDVETGRSRRVVANEHRVTRWIADHRGVVRVAVGEADSPGSHRLLYRDSADDPWREFSPVMDVELQVLGFHADNRRLIVLISGGAVANGLYLMDAEGALRERLLIDAAIGLPASGAAAGLRQTANGHMIYFQYGNDELYTVYFDPRWEARQQAIDEALAGTTNTIVDWSDDERQLLVHAADGKGSSDYYVFDPTHLELRVLPQPPAWLKE